MKLSKSVLFFVLVFSIDDGESLARFDRSKCREKVPANQGLVFRGSQSQRGRWPWLVAFINKQDDKYFGMGSLISQSIILTAAHCLQDKLESTPRNPQDVIVFLGRWNLTENAEPGAVQMTPSDFIIHPDWNISDTRWDADIAIVKLSKDVELSNNIQPICLWTSEMQPDMENDGGTVVGWGRKENQGYSGHSDVPHEVRLKVLPVFDCIETELHSVISRRGICVGGKNSGPCSGDSGGGLFSARGDKWFLRGITSTSLTNIYLDCDVTKPAVFTNVAMFTEWIEQFFNGGEPINYHPEIIKKPMNQGVRVGGVATFFCSAHGDPQPTIIWRKNGKKVSGAQSRYTIIKSNGTSSLRIEPVRVGRDDASYECIAENGVGNAAHAKASLTVYESDKTPAGFPAIEIQFSNRVIVIGQTAILECKASGNPKPKVHWIKDKKSFELTSRHTLVDGFLQISQSEEADEGKYECVAENTVGTEHSKPINIYVKKRRVPPQFVRPPDPVNVVSLGGNLNLTCVAVGSPMPFVRWRKGFYEDITPENEQALGKSVLQLSDITNSANYTCIASSSSGLIETLTMVKVQSLPIAPTDLRISEVTATTVRLEWSYKGPEELQHFVLQHKPKNANQAYSEIIGIIGMCYVVCGLSPNTEYEFHVIGVINIGRGPASLPVSTTTGKTGDYEKCFYLSLEMESPPRNIEVRPLSSSTMVVTWQPPETTNGQINGYKVYYTANPCQPEASWNFQVVDNSKITTISELTPLTIYTIRVQAFTSMGAGPMSNPIQMETQQGVPSQPSNLRALFIGDTTVTLQWCKPSHSGESIEFELYWNDTYANEQHHERIPNVEVYTLKGLYPDTLYYIWLAARSPRGEGPTSPSIPVRTKQYEETAKTVRLE